LLTGSGSESSWQSLRYWVDFSDVGFFRLQAIDLYYVGGFGVMGWVEAQDYKRAALAKQS